MFGGLIGPPSFASRGWQRRSCWQALVAAAFMGTLLRVSPLPAASRSDERQAAIGHAASATVASTPGQAQPSSGQVTIESDQQQADNVTGVITAIGNVRITYPARGMIATAKIGRAHV